MSSALKQHHRLPLWKRAALHGFKVLAKRHPGAVLSAAGAGVAYAGREVAQEGAEFVREKVATVAEALAPDHASPEVPEVGSAEERQALLRSLTREQRAALADLAKGK
jgi:hypothetical protein